MKTSPNLVRIRRIAAGVFVAAAAAVGGIAAQLAADAHAATSADTAQLLPRPQESNDVAALWDPARTNLTAADGDLDGADAWPTTPAPTTTQAPPHAHTEGS